MNFEPFSNCSYLAKNFTLRWSFSPTRRYYSLIPVAMEGYDKIEWIKSWHMLVVLHCVAEKQFESGLFSKYAFWRAFIWPLSLRNTRIRHVSYTKRKLFIVAFKCHQNLWIISSRWRERALWFWQSDENQHSNVNNKKCYFFFLLFWSLHWEGSLR